MNDGLAAAEFMIIANQEMNFPPVYAHINNPL